MHFKNEHWQNQTLQNLIHMQWCKYIKIGAQLLRTAVYERTMALICTTTEICYILIKANEKRKLVKPLPNKRTQVVQFGSTTDITELARDS